MSPSSTPPPLRYSIRCGGTSRSRSRRGRTIGLRSASATRWSSRCLPSSLSTATSPSSTSHSSGGTTARSLGLHGPPTSPPTVAAASTACISSASSSSSRSSSISSSARPTRPSGLSARRPSPSSRRASSAPRVGWTSSRRRTRCGWTRLPQSGGERSGSRQLRSACTSRMSSLWTSLRNTISQSSRPSSLGSRQPFTSLTSSRFSSATSCSSRPRCPPPQGSRCSTIYSNFGWTQSRS
mmetsp:Transcript_16831/g.49844  ORF Transcript_16831/g.49844 Transcript_16831/m.49844 type:complete len:239 (-) Transcript_16831:285-1001(-)